MKDKYFAFISYSRFDDDHNDGLISKAKERLESEIRSQTGIARQVFQDKSNIALGDKWDSTIKDALDCSNILIPFISPSFFSSSACRDEALYYSSLMNKVGSTRIIIPIYLITCPEEILSSDEVARIVFSFQYHDWRPLVFTRENGLEFRENIFMLGSKILKSCPAPSLSVKECCGAVQIDEANSIHPLPPRKNDKKSLPIDIIDSISEHIPMSSPVENVFYGDLSNGKYEDVVIISRLDEFEKIITVLVFDEHAKKLNKIYSAPWFERIDAYFLVFSRFRQKTLVIESVGGSGRYLKYAILGYIDNEFKILLQRDMIFDGSIFIDQNNVIEMSGKQGVIFNWTGRFFLATQLLIEPIYPAVIGDIIVEFSIENDGTVHCQCEDTVHMHIGQGLIFIRTNYGIVERIMFSCNGVLDFVNKTMTAVKQGETQVRIVPGGYDWEKALTLTIVVE